MPVTVRGTDILFNDGTTQSSGFSSSKASNGYVKDSAGVIIQWGTASIGVGATSAVTLPITFPNAITCAVANGNGSKGNQNTGVTSLSTSSINIFNGDNGASTCSWIAIGY